MLAATRWIVMAACALLPLSAAATIEIVYTLRISYVLCVIACILGFPYAVDGWRRVPTSLRVAALSVALVYLLAAILGSGETLEASSRAGTQRSAVYLLDAVIGLCTLGVVVGAFRSGEKQKQLLIAFVGGAGIVALYGIVQWPARHYGWAIANVNNALNPDAVSRGEVFQGTGLLLGWERIRGTFTEPIFFGLYLAAMLPLAAVLAFSARGQAKRFGALVLGVVVIALGLSSSLPSWAIAAGAVLTVAIALAIGRGAEVSAAAAAAGLALAAAVTVAAVVGGPASFSVVTGRDAADYKMTTAARTDAWSQAVRVWSERPLLGHGPGQSAVQLRYRQTIGADATGSGPVVLGSAQGLLTAALVDAGILGLLAWLALLAAVGVLAASGSVDRPSPMRAGLVAAVLAALGGALVSGDRLEVQTWLILGLATAAAVPKAATRA